MRNPLTVSISLLALLLTSCNSSFESPHDSVDIKDLRITGSQSDVVVSYRQASSAARRKGTVYVLTCQNGVYTPPDAGSLDSVVVLRDENEKSDLVLLDMIDWDSLGSVATLTKGKPTSSSGGFQLGSNFDVEFARVADGAEVAVASITVGAADEMLMAVASPVKDGSSLELFGVNRIDSTPTRISTNFTLARLSRLMVRAGGDAAIASKAGTRDAIVAFTETVDGECDSKTFKGCQTSVFMNSVGFLKVAPVLGVPVALFSDGAGYRLLTLSADGKVRFSNAKTVVEGPTILPDETAVFAFDDKGDAIMVRRTASSDIEVTRQLEGKLQAPVVIEKAQPVSGLGGSTGSGSFAQSVIAHESSLAVSARGGKIQLAWLESDADGFDSIIQIREFGADFAAPKKSHYHGTANPTGGKYMGQVGHF